MSGESNQLQPKKSGWKIKQRLIETLDIYGMQVQMNVNGSGKFKTGWGAFISMGVLAYFLVQSLFKFQVLLTMQDFKITANNIVDPVDFAHTEYINLTEAGIDYAVRVFHTGNRSRKFSSELGNITVRRNNLIKDPDLLSPGQFQISQPVELSLGPCSREELTFLSDEEFYSKGIDEFLCVKDSSQEFIGGQFMSHYYSNLEISVNLCTNDSDPLIQCASPEELQTFFSDSYVTIFFFNKYFDQQDMETPVKHFLQEGAYYPLSTHWQVILDSYVTPVNLTLLESLNPFSLAEKINFATFSKSDVRYADRDSPYRQQLFKMNINENIDRYIYVRTIYSFSDFLSDIGGLWGPMYFIGHIFSTFFTSQSLNSYLISQFYQIDSPSMEPVKRMNTKEFQEANSKDIGKQQVLEEVMQRQVFSYSLKELAKHMLLCKRCKSMENAQIQRRQHRLFQKGIEKITKHFDVVNVLETQIQFEIILNLILKQDQRFLLNFNRRKVIFEEDSEEENHTIKSYFNDIQSQNPYERLRGFQKLGRNLNAILRRQGSHGVDQKLLRGIVKRPTKVRKQALRKERMLSAVEDFFGGRADPDPFCLPLDKSGTAHDLREEDDDFPQTNRRMHFIHDDYSLPVGRNRLGEGGDFLFSAQQNNQKSRRRRSCSRPNTKNSSESIIPENLSSH